MPMNFPENNLVQQYLNTRSLEETAVEQLKQLADEYPYDIVIQFLLSKKYSQLQHADFTKQATKTSLYFNNPYWLNILLSADTATEPIQKLAEEKRIDDAKQADNIVAEIATATEEEVLIARTENLEAEANTGEAIAKETKVISEVSQRTAADDLIASLQESLRTAQNNFGEQTIEKESTETIAEEVTAPPASTTEPEISVREEVVTTIQENLEAVTNAAANTSTGVADELIATLKENLKQAEERRKQEIAESETVENVADNFSHQTDKETTEANITEEVIVPLEENPDSEETLVNLDSTTEPAISIREEVATTIQENLEAFTKDAESATTAADELTATIEEDLKQVAENNDQEIAPEISLEQIEENAVETVDEQIKNISEETIPESSQDVADGDPNDTDIDATPEAPKETTGSLEGKIKLSDIWKQPLQNEDAIPVEPLHTIDYFASQGIKLSQIDNAGQDKLSMKLKSFTEWLKTMKRIHPEKLETSPEQVQTVIQHIAESSNVSKEVLTESIAEVFARQGLKQKAIEVYEKLSLQNPDKSAYFAAKISKLNES